MRYRATASFLTLLSSIRSTLAISAYMADRIVLVSATDGTASVRAHEIARPMGLAVAHDGRRLRFAVSGHVSTLVFAECPQLVGEFAQPSRPCGGLLLPRAVLYTGNIDGHDAAWVGNSLLIANTRFSCIARISDAYGFEPVWQPPFISALEPEDRCHLNGLACTRDGMAYATAFSATDTRGGWRDLMPANGILLNISSGEVMLDGLCVPHSPRLIGEDLLLAESGTGRVLHIDPDTRRRTTVAELPGFTRGIDHHGDVLFVGLSKLREGRKRRMPIEDREAALMCGVAAIDRASGRLLGWLAFDEIDEVFDVRVLPGLQNVVLEPPNGTACYAAIDLPGRAFWSDPNE